MTWQLYQLRYRLLSPLHVGWQKVGNIQRTRHYVMARQMWGALTAKLTRSLLRGESPPISGVDIGDYEAMGKLVSQQIAFSYLFPEAESGRTLLPHHSAAGVVYGYSKNPLDADCFAWRYLASYASTALNYEANAAEEGALHETEFITPQTKSDGGCPSYDVYFNGFAFVHKGCVLEWEAALQDIQVGGERKSGWGRMRLHEPVRPLPDKTKLFDMFECDLTGIRPMLTVGPRSPLPVHVSVGTANGPEKVAGEVEPLVSRSWERSKGAGQDTKHLAVCYVPGTVFLQDEQKVSARVARLRPHADGFWEIVK